MLPKSILGLYLLIEHNLQKELPDFDTSVLDKSYNESEIMAFLSLIMDCNEGRSTIWRIEPLRLFNEVEKRFISAKARILIQTLQKANIMSTEQTESLVEQLMEESRGVIDIDLVCKAIYYMFLHPDSPDNQVGTLLSGKEKIS